MRRDAGFTLFEMVVVICAIVFLYMVAERRLNELPAAAERASFYAVLEQVRTGVNLAMISAVARQQFQSVRALEGSNPMNLLLETPRNYRGEIGGVDGTVLVRNSWYFDRGRGELLYVVGPASEDDVRVLVSGAPVDMGIIRLRLTNLYGGGGDGFADWEGLVLRPVYEFTWEREAIDLADL